MTNFAVKNRIRELSTGGFHLALRIGFAYPKEVVNELPEAWVECYTENTYAVRDPTLRWAFLHTGAKRFVDFIVAKEDGHEILIEAKSYGMNHGAVVSVADDDGRKTRSYGTFTRPDRDFGDSELEELFNLLTTLHRAGRLDRPLTRNEMDVLKRLRRGQRIKDIAADLGVSEEAIHVRLKNAREKLGANSSTHALVLARELGLI